MAVNPQTIMTLHSHTVMAVNPQTIMTYSIPTHGTSNRNHPQVTPNMGRVYDPDIVGFSKNLPLMVLSEKGLLQHTSTYFNPLLFYTL